MQTWKKLRTLCRKSCYFEDFLSQLSRSFYWGWEKKTWRRRIEVGYKIFEIEGWRMDDLEFKIEDAGLWIEDRHSRFEDLIMQHQDLMHIFLFSLCRESRYFKDFVRLWILHLRTIHNFFQVCMTPHRTYGPEWYPHLPNGLLIDGHLCALGTDHWK